MSEDVVIPEGATALTVGPDEVLVIVLPASAMENIEEIGNYLTQRLGEGRSLILAGDEIQLAKVQRSTAEALRVRCSDGVGGEHEVEVPPGPVRDAILKGATRGISIGEQ